MSRSYLAPVVSLAALVGVVAGADVEKNPAAHLGIWTRAASDGSTITLTIEAKRLSWEAIMPGKGTTTLTVPAYEISQEGVLFGYVSLAEWTDGINRSRLPDGRQPFACRLKSTEDSLEISELRMFGADENACKGDVRRLQEIAGSS